MNDVSGTLDCMGQARNATKLQPSPTPTTQNERSRKEETTCDTYNYTESS
jgi:hypothetical protein